ncbi:MAG: DUF4381 domain-containing protein [Pseudomonadales bacterium]
MEQNPLDQLRDIHLPEAIGLWPLAPGWWLLLVLCLLAVGLLVWHIYSRRRDQRYRTLAAAELEPRYKNFQHSEDAAEYISASQEILRRAALHRYAERRAAIAPLSGSAWISFLDSCIDKELFSSKFGEKLNEAHYQRVPAIKPSELHRSALYWLRHHK